MSIAPSPRSTMTAEELFDLPDDGKDRWLIEGQLREEDMTYRNPMHSGTEARIASRLDFWSESRGPLGGLVFSGEAAFRILKDPDTVVGIDVAYVSREVAATIGEHSRFIDGIPILAVEILSPSDSVERVSEKLALYRKARVPMVWIVDPYQRTITIHRMDRDPVLFSRNQELTAEPELPGFRARVSDLIRG